MKPRLDWVWWAFAAFIIICAVWASNTRADTNVFVGAWSEHLFSGDDYNEEHRLLALEHDKVFAGYFRNSYDEDTFTAAYKLSERYGGLEAGVYVGAMYGYRHCLEGWANQSRRVCPMAAPFITWDAGPVNPQIFLLGEALAISIRVGF